MERNILDAFKYDDEKTTLLYEKLAPYKEHYDLYAFVEAPIVVYGLSHQTAPFETVGRHKMTLEILEIPYKMGDPSATSKVNWKKIIGLYDSAKDASHKNSKDLSALTKEAKSIRTKAELMGYDEKSLLSNKVTYMDEELASMAERYKEIKRESAKFRKEKKADVKQVSVDACLKLFPKSRKYLVKKSARATKMDDDLAESFLLAECGRTLFINGIF